VQGEHDPRQPREFYEGIEGTMPDAIVAFVDAGHFFVLENPTQTTKIIRDFLAR
jgi:pimeloyl-ACP methyl ester carboxylesterase